MSDNNLKREIQEYFNSFSSEEFKALLEEAGFEVEDGEGRIIFTDGEKSDDKLKGG